MTDAEEVLRIYRNHVSWYESVRKEHEQHRAFYSDDAWSAIKARRTIPVTGEGAASRRPEARVNKTQVNLVRPWVTSFIASLYYRGVKFSVAADERDNSLTKDERNKVSAGIAAELNRFFEIEDSSDAGERMFTMGLLYRGGTAFKLGVDDENELIKDRPEDRIWMEALPPYECVWDRRTRSRRTTKYMGHLYVRSEKQLRAEYKIPPDIKGIALQDVIKNGFETNVNRDEDETYLRVLELTAFEETAKTDDVESQGEFSIWLVDDKQGEEMAIELDRTAAVFAEASGAPMANLVPFISEPVADAPLDSYSPAKSVVELNSEYNIAASVVSEAFRRDSNRIILYLKNKGVSDDDIARIKNGEDLELIGLDADTFTGVFEVLQMPPVSNTLLEYIRLLQDSVDRTQLIADFARGKAGDYLSATEVANLVNYTETTIGRIRKRMDAAISRVAALYLRALRSEMKGSLKVDVDGETITVTKEHLDQRWKIQVIDTASTPAAAAQKNADIAAAQDQFLQLAELVEKGGSVGAMAEEILAIRVGLMDLPPSMLPSSIKAAAPPPAPAPPPEVPPSAPETAPDGGGAGLQPGDVANSPVGQAIMTQAEAEGG